VTTLSRFGKATGGLVLALGLSSLLPACQCSPPSPIYPKSPPATVGNTVTPICLGDTVLDFNHQFWSLSMDQPKVKLCQPGDKVSLKSGTSVQYISATGVDVPLRGPDPYFQPGCA